MSLQTLAAPIEWLLVVKKSRFLARAAHADSLPEAVAQLDAWRDPSATHNCWAARCGQQYRFSDDGEPGGTAGRPILAAIDDNAVDEVVVVVTRWFGGIKLGAGGLMRAYGGAAARCLREAERIDLIHQHPWTLELSFEHAATVHQHLQAAGATKTAEHYDAHAARIDISVPADRSKALREALRDATRGQIRIHERG